LVAHPTPNRHLIPLPRPALGFLRAETEGTQKAADVVGVIRDTETAADHIDNPGAGPQVGGVSEGRSAFQEHADEFLSLFAAQLMGAARNGHRCQAIHPVVTIRGKPTMHRATVDSQLLGYLAGAKPFAEKINSLESPPFEGSSISIWSHVSPPQRSMRH